MPIERSDPPLASGPGRLGERGVDIAAQLGGVPHRAGQHVELERDCSIGVV